MNGDTRAGGHRAGTTAHATHEIAVAKRVFKRWLKSRGWTIRELARRLRAPYWRATQLAAGRYVIRAHELAELGEHAVGYLATLRRELESIDRPRRDG